jgi:hypothetical protein
MAEACEGREVAGMGLRRRRSVLVRMAPDGRKLETARVTGSPAGLRRQITRAGKRPRVVLEAAYGWYWAADTLAAAGAEVHLAHLLGVEGSATAGPGTVGKTLRAWPACCGWGGCPGRGSPRRRSASCASWPATGLTAGITVLEAVIAGLLACHDGYHAIRALPGISPVLAAVIVAGIGDITRFATPARLCSQAGLTPRHRESDTKVSRGHITKQGSPIVRCSGFRRPCDPALPHNHARGRARRTS